MLETRTGPWDGETRSRLLVDLIPDVLWVVDLETRRFTYVSPSVEQLLGYTVEEALTLTVEDVLTTRSRELISKELPARMNAFHAGKPAALVQITELEQTRKDGSTMWAELKTRLLHSDGGGIKILGVSRDITERKRAQEALRGLEKELESQLRHSQKMEAVGQLAGGVAHDFNNMLTVILGFGELALGKIEPADPLHADLTEMVRAAQRSADLTKQLLAFARKQTVSPRVVDLNALLASLQKMMFRLAGEDIAVRVVPGPDLWPVLIDPAQVDHIVANLVANARDAIANVGTISLATANVSIGEEQGRSAGIASGDYVVLTVSDSGAGMDEATRERIFEPFYTTKQRGKGTGLGLATVYGIVRQNGGFIDLASEPGAGTTFTIYLPRFRGTAEHPVETNDSGARTAAN